MARTSEQQRSGYVVATSNQTRKFLRRNDQKIPFAVIGQSLRRLSLVCRVRGFRDRFHALIVDPTPFQEDISCDRCARMHKSTNVYCTGNRRRAKTKATNPKLLYSIRTGSAVGRVKVFSESSGPKRPTAQAIVRITGADLAALPVRFPDKVLLEDENVRDLIADA